jgi:two-component system, OmpR family, sensor histidine kinase SenX3
MVVAGRKKSIAFFIALGIGLILVIVFLYIGWVLLNWRTGILLFFGVLLLAMIISGIVLNTIFLVREIRRNAQHDAFINAVTHELKTPVASIRLYLQTLQTRTVDEGKRREFYGFMLNDSERLLTTIEQVLRTGRVGPSTRLRTASIVDFNSLLEGCLDEARNRHQLQPDCIRYASGQPVRIRGDADELRAAVSNLIDNAVKYSGNHIDVAAELRNIEGKYVALRIKDRGMGIPKSELKRIFKRFYRVSGPNTARLQGTGLGLYIVRSVAKRHRGRAWAESDGLGHGSTFVLQLPMAR